MKLLQLRDVYKMSILSAMNQCIDNTNVRISKYITKVPNNLPHYIRNSNEFVLPYFRINQVKYNFEYQALKLWNGLPNEVKLAKSLKCFKKNVY